MRFGVADSRSLWPFVFVAVYCYKTQGGARHIHTQAPNTKTNTDHTSTPTPTTTSTKDHPTNHHEAHQPNDNPRSDSARHEEPSLTKEARTHRASAATTTTQSPPRMPLPHSRGDKRRRHSARPTGDAARMTNTLEPRKPHTGMRERGGEADLTPHDTNHPRSSVLKRTRAKRAPLPLSSG